ncbi:hypothetical protein SAMN05444920_10468 [Nonomuraea solani]|uniref:Uncharacterized protein n=1 Tax=Nonomuraea solani TaxID=1144553 RepID=A0A1H6CJY0_9ACTN|nr:hypothetical protein [Nonomuraea solani]SEG73274.1 hypothetical protein SAMN05444920_10468 [Nonomuraea solani]
MNQLHPCAGATKDSPCPKTVLTSGDHDRTLTVTNNVTGESVRLAPSRLYHYRHDSTEGLAALDTDGLVLADLPGDWYPPHLRDFALKAGLPLEDARDRSPGEMKAVLAARAPGWQRIRGLPLPSIAKWRKPVAIGVAVAGVVVMAYLASLGLWAAWRGLSSIGRLILDILEAKWLVVAFSPALLFLRPAMARAHRWRRKRGTVLGPAGGPYLSAKSATKLQITYGNEAITEIYRGENHGQAFSLLLYSYENLTGLLILDRFGRSLHHLPGRWSPEEANRFADRHGLMLAVHRVTHEEYLSLTKGSKDATP